MIIPKNLSKGEIFSIVGTSLITIALMKLIPQLSIFFFGLIPTSETIASILLIVIGWFLIYKL